MPPPALPDTTDPFLLLGIDRSAAGDIGAIKSAFRRLSKAYHPDASVTKSTPDDVKKRVNEDFSRIISAYEELRQGYGYLVGYDTALDDEEKAWYDLGQVKPYPTDAATGYGYGQSMGAFFSNSFDIRRPRPSPSQYTLDEDGYAADGGYYGGPSQFGVAGPEMEYADGMYYDYGYADEYSGVYADEYGVAEAEGDEEEDDLSVIEDLASIEERAAAIEERAAAGEVISASPPPPPVAEEGAADEYELEMMEERRINRAVEEMMRREATLKAEASADRERQREAYFRAEAEAAGADAADEDQSDAAVPGEGSDDERDVET